MVKKRISKISLLHYWKLIGRSILLLVAAVLYFVAGDRLDLTAILRAGDLRSAVLIVIWVLFVLEMILRYFPSRFESMGCQKQFKRNFHPTNAPLPAHSEKGMWICAAAWIALNGAIGASYFCGIIDQGIVLLICLLWSVCDMICILFFCPFQTWFLKNKCCATCRIYNWDFAMMFTPLLFIPSLYTWSLLGLGIGLLVVWEVQYKWHPERFFEQTNKALSCGNCQEKLCWHKQQLQSFHKKQYRLLKEKRDQSNKNRPSAP